MRIMRQRFLWPDILPDANPPPLSRLGTGWGVPEGKSSGGVGFTRGVVVPDVLWCLFNFRCRICLTDEEIRCEGERMENLNLENRVVLGVRKFCYLGDMLNGGGSRLASISRVGCGWKKLRELSGILTSKMLTRH